MLTKPSTCGGCALHNRGVGFSHPDGSGRNQVLLVGDSLGADEIAKGLPFQGQAGAQLNRTLSRSSHIREDFKIDNVVRCRPPGNFLEGAPYELPAITHCTQYTDALVQAMKPRVIVPMGNVPMHTILGRKGIEKARGYVYEASVGGHDCLVVPTYHPSFVMRGNQKLTGVSIYDINRAVRVARSGYREPDHHYLEYPTVADATAFAEEARIACGNGAWLTCDIETPRTGATSEDEYGEIVDADILRVSFAYRPHHAITMPWERAYFGIIGELLRTPTPFLVFWNADFDVPRLQANGFGFGGTEVLDAMWAWHFLQSNVPKGLGFVSTFFTELKEWKSLSMAYPEYYSAKDSDAAIQCAYGIRDLLVKEGRFDRFVSHGVRLDPLLKEMGRSGVLLDMDKRAAFRARMQADLDSLDARVQAAVPVALKPFKARRKVPADATLGGPATGGRWGVNANGEWGVEAPWLYNSTKQLQRYIRAAGHPVPRNYKTGRDTTAKDEVEALARKYPRDPLYGLIVEAREVGKVIGQYIDGYGPDPDGRVRTHFTNKPSTWRLASERPNVQNVRRRWHLAAAYREQFVAAPGNVLVELDYKAIEAVLVGYYAKDEGYVKAAKLGVHAILGSHIVGSPIDPLGVDAAQQIRALKRAEPATYDMAKMIVHSSNYLASARRIYMEWRELFTGVKQVQDLQDLYFATIGRLIKGWHRATLELAHRQCYLESAFQVRHYFWDITHYDGKSGGMVLGDDAKRAIAFLPQSSAASIIREAMLRIGAVPGLRKMLRWTVHDSLLFEVPKDRLLKERVARLVGLMVQPIVELGGLTIDVDVKSGSSWGDMREFDYA